MAHAPSVLSRNAPVAAPLNRSGRVVASVAPLRLGVAKRVVRSRATDTETGTGTGSTPSKPAIDIDFKGKFDDFLGSAQKTWDDTEDKPAVLAIGVAAFVGLWAVNGVANSLEKLPLVGGLLELIGILVTGWFVYRYLVFGPDREELKENIDDFVKKITGS